MKILESEGKREKLKTMEHGLWKHYDRKRAEGALVDINECIFTVQQIRSVTEKLRHYDRKLSGSKSIQEYTEELHDICTRIENMNGLYIEVKKQKDVYSCPSCHSKIKFKNSQLELFVGDAMDTGERSLADIKLDIRKLKAQKTDIEQVKETACIYSSKKTEAEKRLGILTQQCMEKWEGVPGLEEQLFESDGDVLSDKAMRALKLKKKYFEDYLSRNIAVECDARRVKEDLENNAYSSVIVSLHRDISKLREKIKNNGVSPLEVDAITSAGYTEEKLYELVNTETVKETKWSSQKKLVNMHLKSVNRHIRMLKVLKEKYVQKYAKITTVESLDDSISRTEAHISELEIRQAGLDENIRLVELYKVNKIKCDEYSKWDLKVQRYKEDVKERSEKYRASLELMRKVQETESIIITGLINSINASVQTFIDVFFEDDPMKVEICAFKKVKKNIKYQVTIHVEYRGEVIDLSMLSGGMYSRVNLAYTLALSEMFNSSVILLDESISTLDSELSTHIINNIKHANDHKLIVLICHQVVTGIFDKIIKL
jgi:ABC-type oligopeptide transport system ATPase subunit